LFIDFEGIDGSGKTTLSEYVAGKLKSLGVHVYHTREKGEYKSRISKSLRKVVRNPQNLGLLPWAEFLVYMARDAQVFEERIQPHLREGGVVISDRYFYSHVLLGAARGLPSERLQAVMEQVSGGLLPDLVVYCDIDIHTSRVRKKIADIIEHDIGSFARKGLSGIGLRNRMREGFLKLTAQEPERWVVVENVGVTEEEISEYVYQVVLSRLVERGFLPPEHAGGETCAPEKRQLQVEVGGLELPGGGARLIEQFYSVLEEYVDIDNRLSAYHVIGVDMPQADKLREKLKDTQPGLVAYGLEDLKSEAAWVLRRELAGREPGYVVRSLAGFPLEGEALKMRQKLKSVAPAEVAKSLKGLECDVSMQLREELFTAAPEGVLASIKGMDTDRAWEFRDRCGKKLHREALAESLAKIDSQKAWKVRHRLLPRYAPWVLRGLGPIDSEEAWELRDRYVSLAPKLVARTLNGMDSDRAHDMREIIGDAAKQVLDSLKGLQSHRAWNMRERLKGIFPSTAVSSLGKSNDSEKAWRFRRDMVLSYPGDLLLLKHVVESLWRTGRP
jgi:dTMP kinase